MGWRNEQCRKVCRIIDNYLANRPTERDSLIVAVRKAFDALEAHEEQRWIPVTERLPVPYDDVWCCSDIGQVVGYCDATGFWVGRGELELIVTAWMPLPEPYQGGGEADE